MEKWVINYKRFIPTTFLFVIIMFILTNLFAATVNTIAAKYRTAKYGIYFTDSWETLKFEFSYPLFKDEFWLKIENDVYDPIIVERIWLNYTKIPVPDGFLIEPGKAERLMVSSGDEYRSCKQIVVKVWYRYRGLDNIKYLERSCMREYAVW